MTTWADIVASAMIQIDDVRLQEQMAVSPAQFYRRMSEILLQAMPLLSRPPELLAYLKSGEVDATYNDYEWASTEESTTAETVINTEMVGYELCSVTQREQAANGTILVTPYSGATYDAETGTVTMPIQEAVGVCYDFDFYTDGSFNDLTVTQLRLFALAIAVVWDERFSRSWIAMTPKIHDDSFSTVNEGNYSEKITKRKDENRIAFDNELRWYEQQCAYAHVFNGGQPNATLI